MTGYEIKYLPAPGRVLTWCVAGVDSAEQARDVWAVMIEHNLLEAGVLISTDEVTADAGHFDTIVQCPLPMQAGSITIL